MFIVNPGAGQGSAVRLMPEIEARAGRGNYPFEVALTSAQGDAGRIASEAVDAGFTHIVAVGGDGTSHEIVNGAAGKDFVLGIIPCGSGNDFPKSAGIPADKERAIDTVFGSRVIEADIGKVGAEYFINGLGIGLDGAVSHRFRKLKRMRLQAGYLLAAVQEALSFKAFEAGIIIGDTRFEGAMLLAGASNGFSQGGFRLAPFARIDDGLLDFHAIDDMNALSRLIKIPRVLKGAHSDLKEVEIVQGKTMTISIDRTLPAHMDGEPFYLEKGTHTIEIRAKSLRILSSTGNCA